MTSEEDPLTLGENFYEPHFIEIEVEEFRKMIAKIEKLKSRVETSAKIAMLCYQENKKIWNVQQAIFNEGQHEAYMHVLKMIKLGEDPYDEHSR